MSEFALKDLIVGSKVLLKVVGYNRYYEVGDIVPATVIKHDRNQLDGHYTQFKISILSDTSKLLIDLPHNYSKSSKIETYKLA